jgi:hypothetical protein
MSLNALELDTIVVRVQGEIAYKNLLACECVSANDRHSMVREAIRKLFPLIRYTDLGSEENNAVEGAQEMHRFFQLNAQRKLHLFFLIGAEEEKRVRHYMRQNYQMLRQYRFGTNPNHRLTYAVIQRGEYGRVLTIQELQRISQEIGREEGFSQFLDTALIQDPDIDLNVSSTYYRNTQDPAFVPKIVDEFAKKNGYYGHTPIDPLTGKPVTDSQEGYFRMRVGAIARAMAGQIHDCLKRALPGNTALVSVDGGSGSGKTTLAQECAKYLQ